MLGDSTYFVRADEVEAARELIDSIEERWACGHPPLAFYPAGSWGPAEADEMLARTVAAGTSSDPLACGR